MRRSGYNPERQKKKEYSDIYTIKLKTGKYKGKKFYLSVKKNKNGKLKYGDLIEADGEYIIPSEARNYKGFDYREYLKSKKIYGTIKNSNKNIKVIKEDNIGIVLKLSNNIRNYIINTSNKLLPEKTSSLLVGILIGDKSGISEEIIEDFKISNLSHMLAVSGAHTAYIILGLTFILNKSKMSKKWVHLVTILSLILFMFITNFTPSVTRACFMAIIVLGANLLYRKQDFWTSISISLLIILVINPFSINEIGLQLSYLGTIGIILFNKNVETLLNKNKISKGLSVTISAQMAIMPIMIYRFNSFSLTFFISNVLASPLLGINIILGLIAIFISLVSFKLAKIISLVLNLSLEILIGISEFTSKLPFSSILVKTPPMLLILLIYCFILLFNYLYYIYISKTNLRLFQKKIAKLINKKNLNKFISIIIIIIILFNVFSHSYLLIPKNLRIYFIDVGQGDSCLIITPRNKKILIDGGEGDNNVLLSYLLDRRIKTIDYIMISHFDSDHCNGLIEIIQKLNVKNVLISKQAYFCDEYRNIAGIINSKK